MSVTRRQCSKLRRRCKVVDRQSEAKRRSLTGIVGGLHVVNEYVVTKLDQRMILEFRSDLFQHAQRLSLAYHDDESTGMLMYRINNELLVERSRPLPTGLLRVIVLMRDDTRWSVVSFFEDEESARAAEARSSSIFAGIVPAASRGGHLVS